MSEYTGYVECALWSSVWEGRPLDDKYDAGDLAPETVATMRAEVADFLSLCEREGASLDDLSPAQVGHDFWLTRNGHGAGFWDRGLGERGDKLTTLARSFGESYLYPGDDDRLYVA